MRRACCAIVGGDRTEGAAAANVAAAAAAEKAAAAQALGADEPLPREPCLQALAALRHAKWFQVCYDYPFAFFAFQHTN